MPIKTVTTRLAHGSFGLSLFIFFGPGLHCTMNPGVSPTEAAAVGLFCGASALFLSFIVLKRFQDEIDKTGLRYARRASTFATIGIIIWIAVLIVRVMS